MPIIFSLSLLFFSLQAQSHCQYLFQSPSHFPQTRQEKIDFLDSPHLPVREISQSGNAYQRMKLRWYLWWLNYKKPIKYNRLVKTLQKIHKLPIYTYPFKSWFYIPGPQTRFQQRLEWELVKKNYLQAHQILSKLSKPSLFVRMKNWMGERKNILESLVAFLSNGLSLFYLHSISVLPNLKFVDTHPISDELLQQNFPEEHDSLYLDLINQFEGLEKLPESSPEIQENTFPDLPEAILLKRKAKFDTTWAYIERAYYSLFLAIGIYASVTYYGLIESSFAMPFIHEKAVQYEQKTFNADQRRQELWEGWRESFKFTEGRYPDSPPFEKFPQDKKEYNRMWKSIYEVPDEELQIK